MKQFLPIQDFNYSNVQLALFFENDKVIAKDKHDFYPLCEKLGFQGGKEFVLPNNVPSNISYISWNETGKSFEISKERADIITDTHFDSIEFENHIKDFLEIFYSQEMRIYAIAMVTKYKWLTEDKELYKTSMERLQNIYCNNPYFGDAMAFKTQILKYRDIHNYKCAEWNIVDTNANSIVLIKDLQFISEDKQFISQSESELLFKEFYKESNKENIYNNLI